MVGQVHHFIRPDECMALRETVLDCCRMVTVFKCRYRDENAVLEYSGPWQGTAPTHLAIYTSRNSALSTCSPARPLHESLQLYCTWNRP